MVHTFFFHFSLSLCEGIQVVSYLVLAVDKAGYVCIDSSRHLLLTICQMFNFFIQYPHSFLYCTHYYASTLSHMELYNITKLISAARMILRFGSHTVFFFSFFVVYNLYTRFGL